VAVGTHALFQDDVAFHRLQLAVIDEQHRFGVAERQRLLDKGEAVHVVAMSATPIPRTLELTLYGDLDVSRIDEKPPGRTPVDTRLVAAERLDEVAKEITALGRRGTVTGYHNDMDTYSLAAAARPRSSWSQCRRCPV